jgi:AcrR family transcriptional regulator
VADTVFLRPATPAAPTTRDRILAAAIKSYAQQGVSNTPLRAVADAAGVSVGLVQHYFGNKAGLTAAVDEDVLRIFGESLEAEPMPGPPADHLVELRGRFAQLVHKYPDVMDYVAHALSEGEEIGAVIFDGLLRISAAQGDKFDEHGLVRPELDLLWATINPLILRVGAIILRKHIERHLPEPLYTPTQLQRWDAAVTSLIRTGQFILDPNAIREATESRESQISERSSPND